MAVFENCSVVLDLKHVPYKEKKRLTSAITDNGGRISYVVNQKCSFVVASSLEDLSANRQRSVQKHQIPVVGQQFVWSCLEKGLLLPLNEHILTQHPAGLESREQSQLQSSAFLTGRTGIQSKESTHLSKLRENDDEDIPEFPSHFQVAKYSIFYKAEIKTCSVVELQSARGEKGQQYRVVKSVMNEEENVVLMDKQMHCLNSRKAVDIYVMWRDELFASDFTEIQTLSPVVEKLASQGLQQLLLEEKLNCSTVSQEVGTFVELIWTEALGSLSSILTVPVSSISLNDVSRVEGLLLQVQKCQAEDEVKALLEEVNTLLPLRMTEPDSKQKLVSQKLDLCQLIRDILNMSESTLRNPSPSSLGKYRALRCSIEQVPPQSPEFECVLQLLQDRPVQIHQILSVSRGAELHMFKEELGNIKPLLHSSRPSSFAGILSRGLLLPRVGVEHHGIERTDVGNLGGGIYFSDSLSTSVKYSKPSVTDGSRLLLVCEVALGQCKDLRRRDTTLTCPPEGYNSVHGVRCTHASHSDFEDDEYVVYNTDQVRVKYVVQYSLKEDQLKTFQPHVDMSVEPRHFVTDADILADSEDTDGLEVTKNPLEEVTAGLLDSSGQTLPLQAVHIRCKLMDLLSQVIVFQTYTNQSTVPIEAKYVFPLEETAAVCGFEAFINGKHVIGKVKEKEQARKEYRQAIQKGHGAYLMDQDAPDVFTISVGNLPPGATVLIKVTFITELVVRAGSILFSLPGSVAPWQQSAALNQRTQTSVEKVRVNELGTTGEFSLWMSIEMPYEITDLVCSHLIKKKRTDCKAVISTLPDQTLGADGFQLSFTLSQIHMPRMWVEKHPEKESEACMLVFYPDFESSGVSASDKGDVIILLDTSESMRGEAILNARRLALRVLHSLDRSLRVNIISFGTDYKEAFPSPKVLCDSEVFNSAKKFIMSSLEVGGSTELWRPLRSLNLLPPSHGVRNVLLISDGHVQNQPQTLQMVRENVHHTRLFTCGLSSTANRHMLRALAQAGGGAYVFFDTKTKHTWAEKVNSQVKCMASPGCSSVSVKWQQFNQRAPPPVQAPSQLHSLFSDCHTLVYGFVPHCTQATLFGDLSGQKLKTMVSTTELQKTKGTFLHKLTARAIIRDYEDGSLGSSEAEHEGKKAELKSYIIELSKEFSILSQFTSFVAIEERDQGQPDTGFTDVPKLIAEEDVDVLPYMAWAQEEQISSVDEDQGQPDTGFTDAEEDVDVLPYMAWAQEEQISSVDEDSADVCSYYEAQLERRALKHSSLKSNLMKNFLQSFSAEAEESPVNLSMAYLPSHYVIPRPSPILYDIPHAVPRQPIPEVCRLSMPWTRPLSQTLVAPVASPKFGASSRTCIAPILSPMSLNNAEVASLSALFSTSAPCPPPSQPTPQAVPPPSSQLFGSCGPVFSSLTSAFHSAPMETDAFLPPLPAPIEMAADRLQIRKPAAAVELDPSPEPIPLRPKPFPDSRYINGSNISRRHIPLPLDFCKQPSPSPGAIGRPVPPFPRAKEKAVPPPPEAIGKAVPSPPPAGAIGTAVPPPPAIPIKVTLPVSLPTRRALSFRPSARRRCAAFFEDKDEDEVEDEDENRRLRGLQRNLVCGIVSSSSLAEDQHEPDLDLLKSARRRKCKEKPRMYCQLEPDSVNEQYRRPGRFNWENIFHLQHQDGYWECTKTLSRFLGLDVDFFANVFLKEKGICSLGVKAHTDILRLVATLLVLQLMRVMKMTEVNLFQSLFRLTDSPEPRPACYEAVKRAVDWVCWADRQYPCVYSRLEFGWDWESCTRQLLGLDSLPPCSPLTPVLQRSSRVPVM